MSNGNATSDPTTQLRGRKQYARVAIPLPLTKSKTNGHIKIAVKDAVDRQSDEHRDQKEQVDTPIEECGSITVGSETAVGNHNGSNGAHAETSASHNGVTSISNNNTVKKPTPLRTQLPPDFVPSNSHPTPQTAGSDSSPLSSQVLAQTTRPGAGHIIFGSESSNNPSPTPRNHNAHQLPTGQTARHSPHASIFIPPGHAHHYAEPQTTAYQRSSTSTTQRHGHPAQSFLHHHYRNSRDSNIPSDAAQRPQNSQTQMPNGKHVNGNQDFSSVPPGFHPYQFSAPGLVRGALDNAVSIAHYTSVMFASESFSDVRLQITLEQDDSSVVIAAHKLILARSSTYYQLITRSTKQSHDDSTDLIRLSLPGKWHDLRTMQEATSWLYGCGLLGDAASDVPFKVPGDTSSARLQYALAYVAAGLFLGLPYVAQRGVEIASSLLSWDNLHIALEFALEGGLHQSWIQDHPSTSGGNTPVNDPSATQLLYSIMDFMVASLPHDLSPDASAADLRELARLPEPAATSISEGQSGLHDSPVTHRSSRSVNDPRLSRIRFGELGGPTALARLVSSILYSLPFPLLSILLQHPALSDRLGANILANLAGSVVAQREARRARVLKQLLKDGVPSDAAGSQRYDILYHEEVVKDNNGSPSGVCLLQQRIHSV